MLIFIRILLIVYLLAISVYSFLLIKTQKNVIQDGGCPVGDGKLFVAGALGGALSIYISMFIFKYKLNNLFLMVIMPLLIAVNVYFLILFFSSDFGISVRVFSMF